MFRSLGLLTGGLLLLMLGAAFSPLSGRAEEPASGERGDAKADERADEKADDKSAARKVAELKWAKGVATDFLEATFDWRIEQAEALIDASLKKSFQKGGENSLREWLNNTICIRKYHDAVIESEELAPDQDEASFKGKLKAGEGAQARSISFSLRVAKDAETGKWRVSFIHIKD